MEAPAKARTDSRVEAVPRSCAFNKTAAAGNNSCSLAILMRRASASSHLHLLGARPPNYVRQSYPFGRHFALYASRFLTPGCSNNARVTRVDSRCKRDSCLTRSAGLLLPTRSDAVFHGIQQICRDARRVSARLPGIARLRPDAQRPGGRILCPSAGWHTGNGDREQQKCHSDQESDSDRSAWRVWICRRCRAVREGQES